MRSFWILACLLLDIYGEVLESSTTCDRHITTSCVLIKYMDLDDDQHFESVYVACHATIEFSRKNRTIFVKDANGCFKDRSCRVVYDNQHPHVCNPLNIRFVYLLSPKQSMSIVYGKCAEQMNWSPWSQCDRGMQQRSQSCEGKNVMNMEVMLCDNHDDPGIVSISTANSYFIKKSEVSLQVTRTLIPDTIQHSIISTRAVAPGLISGCYVTSTCILINYITSSQNLQTLHLKCHGNYSNHSRSERTLYLLWSSKDGCNIRARCVLTEKKCSSADVRFFMNLQIVTSVIYSACEEHGDWSCWSRMHKDFQYRFQKCINGSIRKFQIRVYQEITYTSISSYRSTTSPLKSIGISSLSTMSLSLKTTAYRPSRSMLTSAKMKFSSVVSFCQGVEEGDIAYKGRYKFPATKVYFATTQKCWYGNRNNSTENITRTCMISRTGIAYWEILNLTMCSAKSKFSNQLLELLEANITSSNAPTVISSLATVLKSSSTEATLSDVKNIALVIDKCVIFATGNMTMSHQLFDSIQTLMDFDVKVLDGDRTSSFLSNLDLLSHGLVKLNQSVGFSSSNLGFGSTRLPTHLNLFISSESVDSKIGLKFQELNSQSGHDEGDNSILIPNSIWKDRNGSSSVYSFVFRNDKLFRTTTDSDGYRVASKLISATIYQTDIQNATSPIKIRFIIPTSNNVRCSFWQDSNDVHHWSTKGCSLHSFVKHAHQTSVTCACNHLTNFAVLLSPESTGYNPPELKIFSLVGCIVSISALSATIVLYLYFRDLHKSVPQKIFLNFCCSLNSLLLTFTFGIDRAHSASLCHKISALLHFFTLTTFMWMGVECVSLYKSVVKVFRGTNNRKNYLWSSMVLAWGIPAIMASVTSKYSRQQFDKQPDFCVVKGDLYLFTTFLPVTTILVLNLILFIPIMRQIHGHLSTKEKMQRKTDYLRRTRVSLSCVVLLGLTWIFGLFAIRELTEPLQWIFAILNSFQGLFIFVFHVILKYEVQQAVKKMFGYRFQRYSFSRSSRTTGTVKLSML